MTAETVNACGACTLCCILPDIAVLNKPIGQRCSNLGQCGCRIYPARPDVCRGYRCVWLASQALAKPLAAELRPDRCHVVFEIHELPDNRTALLVRSTADDPDAWTRNEDVLAIIRKGIVNGFHVLLIGADASFKTLDRQA